MLQELVKDIPASVPEASEFISLQCLEPNWSLRKEFDDPTLDADEMPTAMM